MSSSAIDQLMQTAVSVRPPTEAAGPASPDQAAFREHLQRAASEARPSQEATRAEAQVEPEEDTPEPAAQEQQDATSQQDAAAGPPEPEAQAAGPTDEESQTNSDSDETKSDDIVLSEEAVAAVDALAATNTKSETEHIDEQVSSTISAEELASLKPTSDPTDAAPDNETRQLEDEARDEAKAPLPADESTQPTAAKVVATSNAQAGADDKENLKDPGPKVSTDDPLDRGTKKVSRSSSDQTNASRDRNESEERPTEQATQRSSTPAGVVTDIQVETNLATATAKRTPSQRELGAAKPAVAAVLPTGDENQAVAILEKPPAITATAAAAEANTNSTALGSRSAEVVNFLLQSGDAVTTDATSPSETRAAAESAPTVNHARFVSRVSGAIRSAQNRDGHIQLRLSPPELGSLRIEITVNHGVVTAHLETETSAARKVLLDNLPALHQRLAEQEIRIEKFDVDVRRDGGQGHDNPGTQDRPEDRSQAKPSRALSAGNRQETAPRAHIKAESAEALSDGLDVRV